MRHTIDHEWACTVDVLQSDSRACGECKTHSSCGEPGPSSRGVQVQCGV